MTNIKTKDTKPKTIKVLNKSYAWTKRAKDNLVSINNKANNIMNKDIEVNEYSSDSLENAFTFTKDKIISNGKKISKKNINNIKNVKKKYKTIKNKMKQVKNTTNNTKKAIKTSKETVKKTKKTAEQTAKLSKKMLDEGRKLATESTKLAVKLTKLIVKATVSMIKGIIAGIKTLVAMIESGGVMAVIAIIIICIIAIIIASCFGIFFSSEDLGNNNIRMSDCIYSLNSEMDFKINSIEKMVFHDEVIIENNKADWKDILSIYTVKLSNGINEQDVLIVNQERKELLSQIYWEFNSITYELKVEKYVDESIGSLENKYPIDYNLPKPPPPQTNDNKDDNSNKEEQKRVLHIYINSKSLEEMQKLYTFNDSQIEQLNELTSEKYLNMWSNVIYGVYASSGEITEWKQKGKEWSKIKIGKTNATIEDIGCLATSVAILIKKSGVPIKNMYTFNPGTFVTALNNNYGFDSNGNLKYSAISKVVPAFKFKDHVYLNGKSKTEKLEEIKKYYNDGYYLSVEVKGGTRNSQHWIAVDKVTNDSILMLDPGSDEIDMWNKYDWEKTSQFIYFQAN